ncbi:hypothetical protein VARIO8X_100151 [Burkholderiales bacterium 8X]|nr:hypothetical protein VARIO8X_100151 [Burkholderiales bacterium 8X]
MAASGRSRPTSFVGTGRALPWPTVARPCSTTCRGATRRPWTWRCASIRLAASRPSRRRNVSPCPPRAGDWIAARAATSAVPRALPGRSRAHPSTRAAWWIPACSANRPVPCTRACRWFGSTRGGASGCCLSGCRAPCRDRPPRVPASEATARPHSSSLVLALPVATQRIKIPAGESHQHAEHPDEFERNDPSGAHRAAPQQAAGAGWIAVAEDATGKCPIVGVNIMDILEVSG